MNKAILSDTCLQMSRHYLSKNVFLCIIENHCVFLDLIKDKYLCLGPDKAACLYTLLEIQHPPDSRPAPVPRENLSPASPSTHQKVAEALLKEGLITRHAGNGKTVSVPRYDVPSLDWAECGFDNNIDIGAVDLLRFIRACTVIAFKMRFRALNTVIDAIVHRKEKKRSATATDDCDKIKTLVRRYHFLRPFVMTTSNRCLRDSLILLEFLSYYEYYPELVFGVRVGPFTAHCWVQQGTAVINDAVANVNQYKPIMIV